MKARWLLLLFSLGLAVTLGVAAFESTPGYMDAEYYFAGGERLAQGAGFTEPFLWNYLDSPAGLPHASHLYWMPLASILAALGMKIAGGVSFFAGRWPFLVLTALVAPLTGWTAFRLTGKAGHALLAGTLAAFSGFYLPYAATTDTFAVYMLLGTMFLLISGFFWSAQSSRKQLFLAGGLGLIAGCMHLSRADGILWLGLAGLIVIAQLVQAARMRKIDNAHSHEGNAASRIIGRGLVVLFVVGAGYLLVMSPWYLRNLRMFGSVFSPGSNRTLWLTDYDQMFSLDPSNLTFGTWLASGVQAILQPRLDALTKNLTTALIVQGGIFLVPLILAGGWALRKDARVRLAGLAWLMTFLAMTVVFPLAGYRGGFLHSGAAVQPLLWALAPSGLEVLLRWASRARKWNFRQAWQVFAVGVAGLAILTSGLVFQQKVTGRDPGQISWNQGWADQTRLGNALNDLGISADTVVMVNNPPGFFLATGRPAIVIPYGDEDDMIRAARRYQAKFVLLDENHVAAADALYDSPQSAQQLHYVMSIDGTHLFEVDGE